MHHPHRKRPSLLWPYGYIGAVPIGAWTTRSFSPTRVLISLPGYLQRQRPVYLAHKMGGEATVRRLQGYLSDYRLATLGELLAHYMAAISVRRLFVGQKHVLSAGKSTSSVTKQSQKSIQA